MLAHEHRVPAEEAQRSIKGAVLTASLAEPTGIEMDSGTNPNAGHRERLRIRFLNGEPGSRTDEALIELLLTYGIPQRDVQKLAQSLIAKFGTLEKVLAADP